MLLFSVTQSIDTLILKVARTVGFEPTARGFGDRCSGQAELRPCILDPILFHDKFVSGPITSELFSSVPAAPMKSQAVHQNRPSKASPVLCATLEAFCSNLPISSGERIRTANLQDMSLMSCRVALLRKVAPDGFEPPSQGI